MSGFSVNENCKDFFNNLTTYYEVEQKSYNAQFNELLDQIHILKKNKLRDRFYLYNLYIVITEIRGFTNYNYLFEDLCSLKDQIDSLIVNILEETDLSCISIYLSPLSSALMRYRNTFNNFIKNRIFILKQAKDIDQFISKIIGEIDVFSKKDALDNDVSGNLSVEYTEDRILTILKKIYEFIKQKKHLNTLIPLINNPIMLCIHAIMTKKSSFNTGIVISTDKLALEVFLQFKNNKNVSTILDKLNENFIATPDFKGIIEGSYFKQDIENYLYFITEYFEDFNIKALLLDETKDETIQPINSFKDLTNQVCKLPELMVSVNDLYTKNIAGNTLFNKYFSQNTQTTMLTPSQILTKLCNFYFHKNLTVASYLHSIPDLNQEVYLNKNIEFESLYIKLTEEVAKKEFSDIRALTSIVAQINKLLELFDKAYDIYAKHETKLINALEENNLSFLKSIINNYKKDLNYKKIQENYQKQQEKQNIGKILKKIDSAINKEKFDKAAKLAKSLNIITLTASYYSIPKLMSWNQTPPLSMDVKNMVVKKLEQNELEIFREILTLEESYWSIND